MAACPLFVLRLFWALKKQFLNLFQAVFKASPKKKYYTLPGVSERKTKLNAKQIKNRKHNETVQGDHCSTLLQGIALILKDRGLRFSRYWTFFMKLKNKRNTMLLHEQFNKNNILVLDSLQPETHSDLWASITEWGSVRYDK